MKKTILQIIEERVAVAKDIKTAVIEYNFEKLPEHKDIKEDNFFGVPAQFNSDVIKETANIIYTM